MDKRTIVFILALFVVLFGVNFYFQSQNNEKKKEWLKQQQLKKTTKSHELAKFIEERTASSSSLPLINIYADAGRNQLLSKGILDGSSILLLSWNENLPQTVYAETTEDKSPLEPFNLRVAPHQLGGLTVYQKNISDPLLMANLPSFGKFDLQLVFINPDHSVRVELGEFTDGHFSRPLNDLSLLRSQTNLQTYQNAIVLLKTNDGYMPAAIFDHKEGTIIELNEIEDLRPIISKPQEKIVMTSGQKPIQKYYSLENPYQQLVFTNYGGALAEINLPFQTDKNTLSVVREIEFDREMVKDHPYNAYFPAHSYYTAGKSETGPFEEHSKGQLGGYYPLLRRDLIETGKRKSVRIPAEFYALNIISQYPELAELVYEVKSFTPTSIVFEAVQSHRRITKTFSIAQETKGAPYCIDLAIKIEGDSRGLWLTTGIPEVEWISGGSAPVLKYRMTRGNKSEVNLIDLPKDSVTMNSVYPNWIVNSNGFLGMILDPLTETEPGVRVQNVFGLIAPSRLIEIGQDFDRFKAANLPGYIAMLPIKVTPGTTNVRFCAGPFSDVILKAIDKEYTDPQTGYNPDYQAAQTFHGWFAFISEPFSKFLYILLKLFYQLTGSWAISIILLTIALRVMLYPLNAWSTKSMLKMQQIAPEIAAIQEKNKKDPKKSQLEIMKLYRERGINPLSGCLPLLIQMPFLIGMFDLLKSSFSLRGAPFIPGWIDDLTAPDVLFSWHTPIFFIGNEFHLLPILLGLVMFLQQRFMSTAPSDPNLMTDQQRQQRAMGNIMTVVFAIMFYNFPSGLNIYWLSSMLLGMLQQWYTSRMMKKKPITPIVLPAKNMPKKNKNSELSS